MYVPEDAAPFGRELAGEDVADALERLLDAAVRHGPYAGVALTGQREGLVFVDDRGAAITISPNVDARASAEGMRIDGTRATEVYRSTGHLPSLLQAAAKYAWLRAQRPHHAERVRYAMPLADWLASTLTGVCVASRSLLIENGLLDLAAGAPPAWWDDFAVPASIVPPAIDDGAIAGTSGSRLGDVPVVLCGGDTQCALAGMGAIAPGDAGVPAGWSAPVQIVTASPVLDGAMRTWAGVHVVRDCYVVESNAGETGRAWQWLLDTIGVPAGEADARAASSRPGANDVVVALGAARMDAGRMNAGVGGLTVPLPLVMSAPGRADIVRAALEGIACAIRANVEQAEEVSGASASELRLGGGMSRSGVFAEIVANVIGRPVRVAATPETSALGAAVLAAPALGVHDALAGAVAAMTAGVHVVEPSPRISAAYEDVYQRWLATCEAFESMP
jgi:autoinducer 2 (AI-2) kinase